MRGRLLVPAVLALSVAGCAAPARASSSAHLSPVQKVERHLKCTPYDHSGVFPPGTRTVLGRNLLTSLYVLLAVPPTTPLDEWGQPGATDPIEFLDVCRKRSTPADHPNG